MITSKKSDLYEIIKRQEAVKKNFKIIGGNGMPQVKALDGSTFEEWLADIKAMVLSLKQDKLTESIVKLTEDFNGWNDEKYFDKLCAELEAVYKNFDEYYVNKQINSTGYKYEEFCYELLCAYDLDVTRCGGGLDYGYDFIINVESGEKFYVEIKLYKSSKVNHSIIKRGVSYSVEYRKKNTSMNSRFVLIIASQVDDYMKKEINEKYKIDIIDISNLLFLVQDNYYLNKELLAIMNDTILELNDIKPKKPENLEGLFKKKTLNKNNIDTFNSYKLIERFKSLDTGRVCAGNYEELCTDSLKYIFDEYLAGWINQKSTVDGLYRMDLICRIKKRGNEFWDFIKEDFKCRYILFEFKNYGRSIKQTQVYTTEKYLYRTALRTVCFLVSRKGASSSAKKAVSGILRETGKLIVILSDEDMINLLKYKDEGLLPEDYLSDIVDDLLMKLSK